VRAYLAVWVLVKETVWWLSRPKTNYRPLSPNHFPLLDFELNGKSSPNPDFMAKPLIVSAGKCSFNTKALASQELLVEFTITTQQIALHT